MSNILTVQIETTNDAFFDDRGAETARILRELADKIENGADEVMLRDYNGNRVGTAEFK